MPIVFETPRLILRKFTTEDAPLILLLNSDPEVIKYVHEPLTETQEQAKDVIENVIIPQYQKNLGRWAIHLKNNNEFIGWCGLKYLADNNETDLGYRLQQIYWGQDFATEAASHTLSYGFQSLQLKVITGKAHAQNVASINVLKKVGMTFKAEEIENGSLIKVYNLKNPFLPE